MRSFGPSRTGIVCAAQDDTAYLGKMQIVVGIITISDRASGGQYQDLGGPAVKAAVEKRGWDVLAEAIIPDDKKPIQETIRSFSAPGCGLFLTTGRRGAPARAVRHA